ncbi:carboxylating nicotinate-nucleotide diphosphorylase [candidate division NPL-UPA2 bacterium]|nr:carboxylating nicotinate-nucleotide diphosphorylase [candidate division NPL-UPA2 bacterium]
MILKLDSIRPLVEMALTEDIGSGDITTEATIHARARAKGVIIAREEGIVAGLGVAELVFKMAEGERQRQRGVVFRAKVRDGDRVKKGKVLAEVTGAARNILMRERTALNFLQRLSGIATLTAKFVAAVRPYKVKIMDTRKTTPGWRVLEKYAVRMGGGYNHRMGLYDGVLVKDNHILLRLGDGKQRGKRLVGEKQGATTIRRLLETVRKRVPPQMKIEVEAGNLREVRWAARSRADIIMLDNMNLAQMKKAVKIVHSPPRIASQGGRQSIVHGFYQPSTIDHRPLLEASGGVNLDNVRKIARTGVDMISVGALTHSAKALDISLEIL